MTSIIKCGQCGCDTAKLRGSGGDGRDTYERVVIECVGCGESTVLVVSRVITLAPATPDQHGQWCGGWED